jgi:hypothetical protein
MKPNSRGWWPWTVAIVVSVLLHGGWFLVLDIESAPIHGIQSERVPLRTMEIATEGPDWLAQLILYSPATFAMPTTAGFSRPLLEGAISLQPPVQPETQYAMLLDRSTLVGIADENIIAVPSLHAARRHLPEFDFAARPAVDRPAVTEPGRGAPIVQIVNPPSGRVIEDQTLSAPAGGWGSLPWQLECRVIVDAGGWVRQVLLDRRTASADLNSNLIRQIHAWRWPAESGADPLHLHIVVRYAPLQASAEGNGV